MSTQGFQGPSNVLPNCCGRSLKLLITNAFSYSVLCLVIAYCAATVAGYLYDFSQINGNRKCSWVIRLKAI